LTIAAIAKFKKMNGKTVKSHPFEPSSPSVRDGDLSQIRILVVDDQNFVRQKLQSLIEPEADLKVVGTASDGAEAIAQVESLQPDIVLIDLEMPGMDGLKASQIIRERFPDCKILILSSHDDRNYVNQAMNAGAKGYLLKSTPAQELIAAIYAVHKGYSYLGPGLFEKIQFVETREGKIEEPKQPEKTSNQEENQLFRQKSLERLASPERLDQLMQIVGFKSWLPLSALGALMATAVVWSIYGRIPITVEGRGVLIHPSKVVSLQSPSEGQIAELKVGVGDTVKKGDVIATVDQIDLRKQLQLQKSKLAQLQQQDRSASSLLQERQNLDKKTLQQQRKTIEAGLKALQELTPTLREKGVVSIQRDRKNLQKRLIAVRELLPTLQKRLDNRRRLFGEGAVSDDTVLQARQEYLDSLAQIDEAESQLKQLDVKEADALKQYLQNLNQIKELQAQLQDLDSKQANLAQQDLENKTVRQKEIQEVEREINKLQVQLKNNSAIVSQQSGRLLEVTVNPGEVVNKGTRLGSIDVASTNGKLVGVTYFSVRDGKKIQSDMTMQITPQTVKRERFGGIIASINSISQFPVTKEAATKLVGNPEVVEGLVSDKQEGLMQVYANLEPDSQTFSGYKWSSSTGPKLKISPGTTTLVRVKVEERAPITFVLPILRSVSGIY
jgi:HlyD family secretion protein